jgi:hypothetical protein
MVASILMSLKTRAQLIRDLQDQGLIDPDASVSRTGLAVWDNGVLEYGLTVVRAGDGTVEWRLAVDDKEFGQRLAKFGRFAVGVHPVRSNKFEWPGATELLKSLALEVRSGLEQVKDRKDLCCAFMSEADVSVGETFIWLPRASYPSRLVKSLILARELADPTLVAAIGSRIEALPVSRDNTGKLESGRDVVVRYARKYSKELGFEVEIP